MSFNHSLVLFPPSQTVVSPLEILIRIVPSNENAEIRYTVDDTEPTMDSNLYDDAISLSSGVEVVRTVRARAYENSVAITEVVTHTYKILPYFQDIIIFPPSMNIQSAISVCMRLPVTVTDSEIHYTIGGADPTIMSPMYTDPVEISSSLGTIIVVKARAYVGSIPISEISSQEYFCLPAPPPVPDVSVSPSYIDFGTKEIKTSVQTVVTVTNISSTNVIMNLVTGLTGTFSVTDDHVSNATIAPSRTATLSIVFSPVDINEFQGTLAIKSDNPDTAGINVYVEGVGIKQKEDPACNPYFYKDAADHIIAMRDIVRSRGSFLI